MAITVKGVKAGREWTVGSSQRITSAKRTYVVTKDAVSADDETGSFVGIPAIGTRYATGVNLFVTSYNVKERDNGGQKILDVEVIYSADESAASAANKAPAGQDIESWGWRSGSVSRDLSTNRATGTVITNSAGQPFDTVPQYDVASPVFTKVVKTLDRKNWKMFANCVNSATVVIGGTGGETYPACTLRCVTIEEERLWSDEFGWQWRYTIGLQYLSNKVKINGSSDLTEIGWDVAITDAGCYVKNNNALERISWVDQESKKLVYATTPQLLNGSGGILTDDSPYNFRVQAYERVTFPTEFYSITPKFRDQITES